MKTQGPKRAARIEARITSEAGRSMVAEVEAIRLSREAQEQFVSMLLNPPPPADALLRDRGVMVTEPFRIDANPVYPGNPELRYLSQNGSFTQHDQDA